ncbi:MAG: RIP metalloprotease RseP [Clostridia bacterium]|nr:RIP metalloprotease RseP [Clostridia bacterium]
MIIIILAVIFAFSVLIIAHELGHFLAARRAGIRVHEFSIGMGPLVKAWKRGETVYSLRALPLGGFNRMAGMEPGDADDPRGFNRQPVYSRMAVIASGSGMNFLAAIVLYVVIYMIMGVPSPDPVVGRVMPGKPADVAGIQVGDVIKEVGARPVRTWSELVAAIHAWEGRSLPVKVERGKETLLLYVKPEIDETTGKPFIGIEQKLEKYSLCSSVYLGFLQTLKLTVFIIRSLVDIVLGVAPPEVAGPVGIVHVIGEAARFGFLNLLSITALLSLNLGLINLFPIPSLDGSRMVFLIVEAVRKRPLDPEKENMVHFLGFVLLMALMVIITYKDIIRIFG